MLRETSCLQTQPRSAKNSSRVLTWATVYKWHAIIHIRECHVRLYHSDTSQPKVHCTMPAVNAWPTCSCTCANDCGESMQRTVCQLGFNLRSIWCFSITLLPFMRSRFCVSSVARPAVHYVVAADIQSQKQSMTNMVKWCSSNAEGASWVEQSDTEAATQCKVQLSIGVLKQCYHSAEP